MDEAKADETTDEEIAARVQKGDLASFDFLLARYEKKILRYAAKFLLDAEESKDIVQEVFIKTYVNIQSFDTSRKFSPWLYRIAHNEFINAGKKRLRERIFSFGLDMLFPHPVAQETADGQAHKREVRQMLKPVSGAAGPEVSRAAHLVLLAGFGIQGNSGNFTNACCNSRHPAAAGQDDTKKTCSTGKSYLCIVNVNNPSGKKFCRPYTQVA
ncbi:MAG: sigma-70 family RNA polymerase sigma factor [Candidatus Sungbacteria bacterium]|nr:sigma-70 family RNA polymerase sigma factor [Candidatus Sungbacteria bacterium]